MERGRFGVRPTRYGEAVIARGSVIESIRQGGSRTESDAAGARVRGTLVVVDGSVEDVRQAVLDGLAVFPRVMPMLMTAAGTVPAAKVFILGAGVAGFRSDGTLDGTVAMRGALRLMGLQVAEARWTVAAWAGTRATRTSRASRCARRATNRCSGSSWRSATARRR